jgi:putative ABC transport system permease protein
VEALWIRLLLRVRNFPCTAVSNDLGLHRAVAPAAEGGSARRGGGQRLVPTARIAAAIRYDPKLYANALDLEPALRRAIAAVDPASPPVEAAEMRRLISDRVASNRLTARLIALFAGLALVLAAVGIYGVFSFSVMRRTHEIGVRMALGATRGRVVRMIVGEAALAALGGIAIGLAGVMALARVVRTLLFGVAVADPLVCGASVAALAGIAILAAGPAIRASRMEPMASLRHE